MKNAQDIKKDITGALEEMVAMTNKAFLDSDSYIAAIMNKVLMSSGKLLYPYTNVGAHNSTTYTVNGLELVKAHDAIEHLITNETIEDSSPKVGIKECLSLLAAQTTHKAVEKIVVDAILGDGTITGPTITGANWEGVESLINALGASVYNTKGMIHVVVSFTDYLKIISESATDNAMKVLKGKVKLHMSEFVPAGTMFAFHEHGVAGAIDIKAPEIDNKPALDGFYLVNPYSTGYAWDINYIKKASV